MIGFILSLYIATFSWSTLRVFDLTIFDLMTVPVFLILCMAYGPRLGKIQKTPYFSVLVLSTAAIVFATLVSTAFAAQPLINLAKGMTIAVTLFLTAINIMMIVSSGAMSAVAIARMMLLSCVCHSVVGILQGQLGLLQGLNHAEKWEAWTRAPGLAEHPIEAGVCSGAGIILGLFLLFYSKTSRKTAPFYGAGVAICAWAMIYSASMTAFLATLVVVPIQMALSRKFVLLYSTMAGGVVVGAALLASIHGTQLGNRVDELMGSGSSYTTVETRNDQISKAVAQITFSSFVVGLGYDPKTLPNDLDIHDGIVAAIYHFGIFGLYSQASLVVFAIIAALREKDPVIKGTSAALILLFLCGYLTGPALSRRSVWFPILAFTAITAAMPRKTASRRFEFEGRSPLAARPA